MNLIALFRHNLHRQRAAPPGDWAEPRALSPHLYKGPDGPTAKSLEALRYIRRTYGDLARYEVSHQDGDPANNDPANLEIREAPEGEQA